MNRNVKHTRGSKPANRSPRPAPHGQGKRKVRRGRRRSAFAPALLIVALLALAAIPVVMLLRPGRDADIPAARMDEARLAPRQVQDTATPEAPVVTLAPQVTEAPTEVPTPEPTEAPTPVPTEAPTAQPTPFVYLPVVHSAETDSKIIAITVDDCYQVNNLKTIVGVAEDSGAKLTLFPVGENLSKEGMPSLMKHCAFDLGFEIENHTWSHARIFRMEDDKMAQEIWKQDDAVNRALGVDYQEHFLRLMGGDGDTDPRIHSYLRQLGYLGIANWSVSGSDSDMKHIKASLAPGQIYLFHSTDPDTKKLKEFIPYAVSKGYKLVTLNAMFNLADNETAQLTDRQMPQPEANVDDHHTLVEGEYTLVAARLQDRLRSLGYLDITGPSTGYYGPQTVKAVKKFQEANGLPATGEADLETQQKLLEG